MEQKLLNLDWFSSLEIILKLEIWFFQSNQCLFITLALESTFAFSYHEKIHLSLHIMGKCMENLQLTILLVILAFSRLNQSMPHYLTWGNAFALSCHGEMHGGISHWPSYWSSLHLVISTNWCLFMSHEECICFFMSWENTWEISHWPSHWRSSHFTISN